MSKQPYSHWDAEVEQLRAASSELVPEATAAVRKVLLSVLAEDSLDPRVAHSARSLLVVLGRLGAPASAPVSGRRGHPGRVASAR